MKYEEFHFTYGKRVFELTEDNISVVGRGLHAELLLRDLEPEYRILRKRNPVLYVGLISLSIGVVATAIGVVKPELGFEGAAPVWILGAIIGVIGLIVTLPSLRMIELAVFQNTKNDFAFEISKSGRDSEQFERFLDEVSARIRQAKK